jgi:hypothetical protein
MLISGTVWRQEGPPRFMGASPPEPAHGGSAPIYGCVRFLVRPALRCPSDEHKPHTPPRNQIPAQPLTLFRLDRPASVRCDGHGDDFTELVEHVTVGGSNLLRFWCARSEGRL